MQQTEKVSKAKEEECSRSVLSIIEGENTVGIRILNVKMDLTLGSPVHVIVASTIHMYKDPKPAASSEPKWSPVHP